MLVEFIFSLFATVLVLVFLTISTISWLNGASLFDFIVHAGISILTLGGLLSLIFKQISSGVLEAGMAEIEEERKKVLIEDAQKSVDESLTKVQ